MASVKAELLKALQDSHPSGQLNGHDIPQDSDDILLAKPGDINDYSQGWQRIDKVDVLPEAENGASGKGKGKVGAAAKATGKAANKLEDCPQGRGLRDGGVVAFQFAGARGGKEDEEWEKVEREGDEAIEVEKDDEVKEEWDVVVPSMEETYGEQAVEAT